MYCKLFDSILDSTLWSEPNHVLRVWLTMLLLCDQAGNFEMPLPGIARRAGVSLDECIDALRIIEAPDPHSRSKQEGGRRAIRMGEDCLWHLVNYSKYRSKQDPATIRSQTAVRVASYRAREKAQEKQGADALVTHGNAPLRTVTHGNAPLRQAEAEAEAKKKTCAPSARDGGFETFWKAYPKKRSKGSAEKAWKRLRPDADLLRAILTAIERGKASKDWQKDDGAFIPYPASWLNAQGWMDELGASRDPRKDVLF